MNSMEKAPPVNWAVLKKLSEAGLTSSQIQGLGKYADKKNLSRYKAIERRLNGGKLAPNLSKKKKHDIHDNPLHNHAPGWLKTVANKAESVAESPGKLFHKPKK